MFKGFVSEVQSLKKMNITQFRSPDMQTAQMRDTHICFHPMDCPFGLPWGKIGLLGAIKTVWRLVTIPEGSQGLLTKEHVWNIF